MSLHTTQLASLSVEDYTHFFIEEGMECAKKLILKKSDQHAQPSESGDFWEVDSNQRGNGIRDVFLTVFNKETDIESSVHCAEGMFSPGQFQGHTTKSFIEFFRERYAPFGRAHRNVVFTFYVKPPEDGSCSLMCVVTIYYDGQPRQAEEHIKLRNKGGTVGDRVAARRFFTELYARHVD